MEEEIMEVSLLDAAIASELNHLEELSKDDNKHKQQVDIVCNLVDRGIQTRKVENEDWSTGAKIASEKENLKAKIEADKELENIRFQHEKELQSLRNIHEKVIAERDNKIKEADLLQREKEVKADLMRTYLEFAGKLILTGTFVAFEIMAHKRDLADVIGSDPMHPAKNPIKIKFF